MLLGLQQFDNFAAAVSHARLAEARVASRRGHARVEEGIANVEVEPPRRQQTPDRRGNSQIVCFYCRMPGHRIRDCRKRMLADKRRQQQQQQQPQQQRQQQQSRDHTAAVVTRDFDMSPFVVEGMLNNTTTQMLVDTGALVSLMSADVAASVEVAPLRPSGVVLRSADKQRIAVKGRVANVPLRINGVELRHDFIVADRLAHPVILGVELLSALGAVIDVRRRRLVFENGNVCAAVVGESAPTRLPSGATTCVVVHAAECATCEHEEAAAALTDEQQTKLAQLLDKHEAAFSSPATEGVPAKLPPMRIDTGDHPPVSRHAYRRSATERTVIEETVKQYLKDGIIKPSFSPWASPVVLVKKKSGEWRFCVDYRKLNAVTVPDAFPMPRLDDTLDNMGGACFFTTLDLASAYHQCPLAEDARPKTAFITHTGLYEFQVVPFGLRNAPAFFQRSMQAALADVPNACIYLDDILLFSSSFDEHIALLDTVLQRLRDVGLRLKRNKCHFLQHRTEYLGHIISADGVRPDPAKLDGISKLAPPASVEDIRRVLGMIGFYRRFIPHFARIAAPLYKLLKKDVAFVFGDEQLTAFNELRAELCRAPVLAYPDFARPFRVTTDASGTGLGAVLSQASDDGLHHPVSFISRTLNAAERNYSVSEQECLGVVWAIRKFRPYVFATQFEVVTDHAALRWLRSIRDPRGRLGRWSLELQDCDFEVIHRPGSTNVVADALSRLPRDPAEHGKTVAPVDVVTAPIVASPDNNDDNDDDGSGGYEPEREVEVDEDPLLTDPDQPRTTRRGRSLAWLTPDVIKASQQEDPLCMAVRAAWEGEEAVDLSAVALSAKQFWSSLHHFRSVRGIIRFDNQVVLPANLIKQALHQAHDHPSSGHLGTERTYRRLTWPLRQDQGVRPTLRPLPAREAEAANRSADGSRNSLTSNGARGHGLLGPAPRDEPGQQTPAGHQRRLYQVCHGHSAT